MPDTHRDPSGNTEAFRTFAHSTEPAAVEPPSKLPLIVGVAVAAAVLVVLVGWLALG
ncbi:hypothetical protein [Plantactinospora sp. CA-290183]|uniref:hypothetical protein n=1 Tax=Plantactinospora sp. CA-290183 TaxID=3240006 RepID=UPI003D8BB7F0